MDNELKISRTACTTGKMASAIGMILLLLFLTGINFFLYPSSGEDTAIMLVEEPGNDGESQGFPSNPAGPDEKSPDAPVSINEEYVHHNDCALSPFLINTLFEHKIHEAEKLCVFHFELLSPPPEV